MQDLVGALNWYIESGVDEAMGDQALDRTVFGLAQESALGTPAPVKGMEALKSVQALRVPSAPVTEAGPLGLQEALSDARAAAAAAKTIEELKLAIENFEGLSIKRTATQIVFADGVAGARIMFVGEAPGADEDRLGKPFAGVSGQLLDRMVSYIGLHREENFYISNILNWRPPGNRSPSDSEIEISLPFIRRHIELANPAILVLVGDGAAKALLETSQGITRLRGKWHEFHSPGLAQPIPTMATLHPTFLLRNPAQKAAVWQDLLAIQARLANLDAS